MGCDCITSCFVFKISLVFHFSIDSLQNVTILLFLLFIIIIIITPWCRVLLEKLTGLQLVKKFPALHGTRRFITALTSVRIIIIIHWGKFSVEKQQFRKQARFREALVTARES